MMITIANGSSKFIPHLRNIFIIKIATSSAIIVVVTTETTLFITLQLQFRPHFFFLCVASHGYLGMVHLIVREYYYLSQLHNNIIMMYYVVHMLPARKKCHLAGGDSSTQNTTKMNIIGSLREVAPGGQLARQIKG